MVSLYTRIYVGLRQYHWGVIVYGVCVQIFDLTQKMSSSKHLWHAHFKIFLPVFISYHRTGTTINLGHQPTRISVLV